MRERERWEREKERGRGPYDDVVSTKTTQKIHTYKYICLSALL